jgi:hypothetical protein
MKRILKIMGGLFLVLILVGLGASLYIGYALPNAELAPELSIVPTPERLERGSYLANSVMGCLDCHAQRDFTKYTAPVILGTQGAGGEVWNHEVGFAGTLYSPNITPAGLKDWTDGEITPLIVAQKLLQLFYLYERLQWYNQCFGGYIFSYFPYLL